MMAGSDAGPTRPPVPDELSNQARPGNQPLPGSPVLEGSPAFPDSPAFPGSQVPPGRPVPADRDAAAGRGPAAGLLMLLAAITLGVAAYLHRNGHIPLGFAEIRGESFYDASIPEAVIAFVLAVGAAVYLTASPAARASAARGQARRVALAASTFAIIGVAYGMTVTISDGRVPDIIYHSCLMAILLIAEALLLGRRTPPATRQQS